MPEYQRRRNCLIIYISHCVLKVQLLQIRYVTYLCRYIHIQTVPSYFSIQKLDFGPKALIICLFVTYTSLLLLVIESVFMKTKVLLPADEADTN